MSRIGILAGPSAFLESSFDSVNSMSLFFHGLPILWLLAEGLLALVNAVLINFLLIQQEIVPRKTHLPAAIFILASVVFIPGYGSIALQLTVLFAVFSSIQLTTLTNKTNLVVGSFFSGVFIGLASVISPFASILLVHSLLGIRMAKGSNLRMWLLQLLGFVVIIYFFWTGFFLFDHGLSFVENYLSGFRFSFQYVTENYESIPVIGVAYILLISLILGITTINHKTMRNVVPRGWMVYWIGMGTTFFVVGVVQQEHIQAFSMGLIPLSALFTLFLISEKRKRIRSFLFFAFVAITILQQIWIINPIGFFGSIW